jgi:hypothetical protein
VGGGGGVVDRANHPRNEDSMSLCVGTRITCHCVWV